jgi:hypothetical protein
MSNELASVATAKVSTVAPSLEYLYLLSIAIIRKIVRTTTTEMDDTMIIRIEVEERVPMP